MTLGDAVHGGSFRSEGPSAVSSRARRADHIEIGERRDFHDVSGLRGVNDHSSSDVHTHVTEVDFEEDEIPGLQRV